jgi:hypothetical protein
MKVFPNKQVAAPYTVGPSDLGMALQVTNAGTVTVPAVLLLMYPKFSMLVENQSTGAVLVAPENGNVKLNGLTTASSLSVAAGRTGLLAGDAGSLSWTGIDMSNLYTGGSPTGSPAPTGSPPTGTPGAAVLTWGTGAGDTINGVAIASNPTLANGQTFSYLVHVLNPTTTPVASTFTDAIVSGTGTAPAGVTVPASGSSAVTGSFVVSGTVGHAGTITLTLHDPYGAVARAAINFVVGPAPTGSPPTGSPAPTGTGGGD